MSEERILRVAVVPGDGVGPEVVGVTVPLLEQAAAIESCSIELTELDWGGARYLQTGEAMPPNGVEQLRAFDAVLFGAAGRPDIPAHVSVWDLLLPLRHQLDLWANLRPVITWEGIPTPLRDGVHPDFLVVRENSEGEYVGMGGRSHTGLPHEVAVEVAIHSRHAIERIAHFAFEQARARRGLLTLVTKSNASRYGYVLWDEVVGGLHDSYPDVDLEMVFVDTMAARMVQRPESLDVLLCSNLFGDILSDLAAPFQGGLGMAPSANIKPDGGAPGIYEPVHGSAPDIAGRGIANPVGCILSVSMLLADHGLPHSASQLRDAVRAALEDQDIRTPDIGGNARTSVLADAVARRLSVVAGV